MRNLTWIALVALTVACNKDGDETGDTDTSDSDTQAQPELELTTGSATYNLKIDDVVACNTTYGLTGTEYEHSLMADADVDFTFVIDATETANTSTAACPRANPWQFTFAQPFPGTYPDDVAGMGFAPEWYYSGYGVIAENAFFVFYYSPGYGDYGTALLSGTFYPGTAEERVVDGTFTNTDGAIAWSYTPDASFSAQGAYIKNCSDKTFSGAGLGEANDYETPFTNYVTTAAETLTGTIQCDSAERADKYTVTVAAGATLAVSLDTTAAANAFDTYLWVNDSTGCTLKVADDQFQCTSGICLDADNATTDGDFNCCSSTQLTNGGTTAATYTIYVAPTSFTDSCKDAAHIGNYSLAISGGTTLTAAGDELRPKLESVASGTGTVAEAAR